MRYRGLAVILALCLSGCGSSSSPSSPSSTSNGSSSSSGSRAGIWSGHTSIVLSVLCGAGINAQCNVVEFTVNKNNTITCFSVYFGSGSTCDSDNLVGHQGTGTPINGNGFTINFVGGGGATGQFDSESAAHGTITGVSGLNGAAWTAVRVGIASF